MELKEHEELCRKILGDPYTEVHQFLDQFQNPAEIFVSQYHRNKLHHFEGLILIALLFRTKEATYAAIIHVLQDCLGYIPYMIEYKEHTVDPYGRPHDMNLLKPRWYQSFLNLEAPK